MNFADERRASGRDMVNERRASGKAFRDDLRALAVSDSDARVLPPAAERAPIPAARGVATYTAPPAASAGGGIASPLTEIDGLSREYYEQPVERFAHSSDYLLALEIRPLKNLHMVDANGDDVVLQFKPVQE